MNFYLPKKMIYLNRIGSESYRSKMVTAGTVTRWCEYTELDINDVRSIPELEIKLKESKTGEIGR